jgi:DNA N-6-adenine-methyltransferase (Dam)
MARHLRSIIRQFDADAAVEAIRRDARLAKGKSIINTATRGDEDKQRIATPWPFIRALEQRFGTPVDFDLAAEPGNVKSFTHRCFTSEEDALKQDWSDLLVIDNPGFHERDRQARLAYLNPPFAHIKPWARKLADCRWLTRWTVMLVPASYSTDWFLELRGKVLLDAIPRIVFEGSQLLYPKDLVLCVAGFGVTGMGYWDWRASYLQDCTERALEPDPLHLKGLKRFPVTPVFPDYDWTPDPFYQPQTPP